MGDLNPNEEGSCKFPVEGKNGYSRSMTYRKMDFRFELSTLDLLYPLSFILLQVGFRKLVMDQASSVHIQPLPDLLR